MALWNINYFDNYFDKGLSMSTQSEDEVRFEDMTCMKRDGKPIVAGTGHCRACIGPLIPNGTPIPRRLVARKRAPNGAATLLGFPW